MLGCLGRDTAGVMGKWLGGGDFVTQLGTFFDELGIGYGDFFIGVFHRLYDSFKSKNAHFPCIWVERD